MLGEQVGTGLVGDAAPVLAEKCRGRMGVLCRDLGTLSLAEPKGAVIWAPDGPVLGREPDGSDSLAAGLSPAAIQTLAIRTVPARTALPTSLLPPAAIELRRMVFSWPVDSPGPRLVACRLWELLVRHGAEIGRNPAEPDVDAMDAVGRLPRLRRRYPCRWSASITRRLERRPRAVHESYDVMNKSCSIPDLPPWASWEAAVEGLMGRRRGNWLRSVSCRALGSVDCSGAAVMFQVGVLAYGVIEAGRPEDGSRGHNSAVEANRRLPRREWEIAEDSMDSVHPPWSWMSSQSEWEDCTSPPRRTNP